MQDDWALFREFVGSNADPAAAQAYVDALEQPGRCHVHGMMKHLAGARVTCLAAYVQLCSCAAQRCRWCGHIAYVYDPLEETCLLNYCMCCLCTCLEP
jgi:hypothetical protein